MKNSVLPKNCRHPREAGIQKAGESVQAGVNAAVLVWIPACGENDAGRMRHGQAATNLRVPTTTG